MNDPYSLEYYGSTVGLQDAINNLLEVAIFLLEAEAASIMLLNKERSSLQLKFTKGSLPLNASFDTFAVGEGIAGWVAQTGKSRIIPFVGDDPQYKKKSNRLIQGSLICTPLFYRQELVGVVNIDSTKRTYKQEDLDQLLPIVKQIEICFTHAYHSPCQLLESSFNLDNKKYWNSLSQAMQEINFVSSKEQLKVVFLTAIRGLFKQADSGFLVLENDDGDKFTLLAKYGLVPSNLEWDKNSLCKYVNNMTPLIMQPFDNPCLCLNEDKQCKLRQYKAKSVLLVNLLVGHEVKGLLAIGSVFPNAFNQRDLNILQIFAHQISLLYQGEVIYTHLKNYSNHIVNSVAVGLACIDLMGRITLINQAGEKILEKEKEELLGKHFEEIADIIQVERLESAIRQLLTTGEPIEDVDVLYNANGRKKTINWSLYLLRNKQGTAIGITLTFRDITERLALEEQLKRTERLLAAGHIAAGAAHEIKNPLTTIKGFTQMVKKTLKKEDVRWEYLDLVLQETEQINHIINQMDGLAKKKLGTLDWLDIPVLIDEVLKEERQGRGLSLLVVNTVYDGGLSPVLGSKHQLKQVFSNIIKNSIEAMEKGGLLSIKVLVGDRDDVVVEVVDTGIGICNEDKEAIFNPFFTSKADGVGLGLALSYKIIREHSGTMSIESQVGKGTKVRVNLPINFNFAQVLT